MLLLLCASAVLAAVAIAGILIFRRMDRDDSQMLFAKAYLKAYRATGNKKESLWAAFGVLRKRQLFAEVTDDDAAFLADLFSDLRHPHAILGRVIQRVETRRSTSPLRDRDVLRDVVKAAKTEGA